MKNERKKTNNAKAANKSQAANRPPFECIALLLQGGGALGAYQAGVYQALSEAELEPDWVAGISIGAVNAAIIAGNAPKERIAKLRTFWELITEEALPNSLPAFKSLVTRDDTQHQALNLLSAMRTIITGIPGFFKPRSLAPWLEPQGAIAATSFYDFAPLKATLESLIDFDRINSRETCFNVGAVHVKSGDFVNFCNHDYKIGPEHVMASGALPPGFPAVEVAGEYYWDGGLISNTPLQWVVDSESYMDTLIFQVDLWSADGEFPQNMADVYTRQKDIQYSSRTRANTDHFKNAHKMRHSLATLLEKLPPELKKLPEAKLLATRADTKVYNIVHLIYHNKTYEGYSKDIEFSRLSMEAHWQSGYNDTINTLKHPEVLRRPHNCEGIAIFDFSRDKKAKKDEY